MLLFVLGVVIILIGVAVSIALHEVGHLVPAKLFGVKVTQYMIGFGKTLFSFRRGETEYGVKAIPLGGYISMIGMFPPGKEGGRGRNATTGFMQQMVQDARTASSETVAVGEEERTFYKLPVWKRIVIMFGGPFMNLVIGVVLFGVLLMGFGAPQSSTTVATVSQCVLPAGSTSKSCPDDAPQGPAAAAGLKPGDTIDSIDGTRITSWDQSTAIAVVKNADGGIETLTVGFVGIGPVAKLVPQPATAVLPAVGAQTGAVFNVFLHLPQRMVDVWNAAFGSAERDPNGPISVVGIGRAAGELTALDGVPAVDKVYTMIGMLASLNIALFVFNLVPLLPLDGGHIAGALWEGLRRTWAKIFRRR
ncbi:MAG: site-2 protease family protein, partial [Leifsonia sp.]|nr:site-2 protease family protein [Leifsonia sp.]